MNFFQIAFNHFNRFFTPQNPISFKKNASTTKAIETTTTINKKGQLILDQLLTITQPKSVRVIVLMPDNEEIDPEETPIEIVIEGIRQGLYEALNGQTIPFSELLFDNL